MDRRVPLRVLLPAVSADPTTGRQPLAAQGAAFLFGGAAPNPGALVRLQRVLEAIVDDGATEAYGDGTLDGRGVGITHREEQGMLVARTSGALSPFGRQLHRQLGWACAHQPEFRGSGTVCQDRTQIQTGGGDGSSAAGSSGLWGWSAMTSLEEGLRLYYNWFLSSQGRLRETVVENIALSD